MEFAREVLGIEPFPWQRWLLIHALELLADGRFRFRTVLVEVARQNGKTSLVEMKNLWKMFVLQVPLIIGTAQNLDVAEESWDKAVEIVESIPELNEEVEHIDRTNGKKALRLWAPKAGPKGQRRRGGPRWKIAAASRRGGRGLSGDDVNLDELREHQKWDAWAAVTKTTMAKPNAQIWAYSNAGDDKSVVLNDLRDTAIAAIEAYANGEPADTSLGIFEWSAGDDIKCTCIEKAPGRPHDAGCKLRDRSALAQANPSLGYGTITEDALESALATDPEAVFRTECLCQRVAELEEGIIPIAQWIGLHDQTSKRDGDLSIGVDISQFRDWAAITIYAQRADGLGHAHLVDYRPGIEWLVPKLVELRAALDPLAVGMGKNTYESLRADLDKAGFTPPDDPDEAERGDLLVMSSADNAAACGQIIDAVRQRSFRVIPAQQLDDAVAGAKVKPSGETIAWARKTSTAEISPICSLTAGRYTHLTRLWLADKAAQNKPEPFFAWG